MKKILFVLLVLFAGLGAMSCSTYNVEAGHVGIIVDLYGSDKGIQQQVVGVGRYSLGMNQKLYTYPIYKIQYPFTAAVTEGDPKDEAIRFQNKDGVKCLVDLAVQAQVKSDNESVVKLFTTYREDVKDIIHTQVFNRLRDYTNQYASAMSVEELYGPQKMEMIAKIQQALNKEFEPQGLVIDNISILGNINFEKDVADAITAKITATQKTLQRDNEIKQAEAEAKIAIAKAEGEAASQRAISASLSPEILQKLAIEKWDGKLPTTNASNALPFLNLR